MLLESRIISECLEDAFPAPPLMSRDPYERHRARHWSKQIDPGLHLNIFTLSFVSYTREGYLAMAEEKREHALPGTQGSGQSGQALVDTCRAAGTTTDIFVAPDVKLDRVHAGDQVKVSLYQGVAAQNAKGDAKLTDPAAASFAHKNPGGKPGGGVGAR